MAPAEPFHGNQRNLGSSAWREAREALATSGTASASRAPSGPGRFRTRPWAVRPCLAVEGRVQGIRGRR